jgi:hypothetical protein
MMLNCKEEMFVRYFTHYWLNKTWYYNNGGQVGKLEHTAGNQFLKKGVTPGDYIYVVTVLKGEPYLLGRLKVAEIVDYFEAQNRLDPDIWEAAEHLLGTPEQCSLQNFEQLIPLEVTESLRFIDGKGQPVPLKFKNPGVLDQQTLRGVRLLRDCFISSR